MFINDITSKIKHCKISFFADDLKIYKTMNNNVDINFEIYFGSGRLYFD